MSCSRRLPSRPGPEARRLALPADTRLRQHRHTSFQPREPDHLLAAGTCNLGVIGAIICTVFTAIFFFLCPESNSARLRAKKFSTRIFSNAGNLKT